MVRVVVLGREVQVQDREEVHPTDPPGEGSRSAMPELVRDDDAGNARAHAGAQGRSPCGPGAQVQASAVQEGAHGSELDDGVHIEQKFEWPSGCARRPRLLGSTERNVQQGPHAEHVHDPAEHPRATHDVAGDDRQRWSEAEEVQSPWLGLQITRLRHSHRVHAKSRHGASLIPWGTGHVVVADSSSTSASTTMASEASP